MGRVVAYREPVGVRVDSGIERGRRGRHRLRPDARQGDRARGGPGGGAASGCDARSATWSCSGQRRTLRTCAHCSARPEVRAGELDTGLIERLGDEVAPPPAAPELAAVALAALTGASVSSDDPWDACDGWRLGGEPAWIRTRLGEADVAVRRQANGDWEWAGGAFRLDGSLLTVGGVTRALGIHHDGDALWLCDGASEPRRFAPASAERAARCRRGRLAGGADAGRRDPRARRGRRRGRGGRRAGRAGVDEDGAGDRRAPAPASSPTCSPPRATTSRAARSLWCSTEQGRVPGLRDPKVAPHPRRWGDDDARDACAARDA